MQGCRQGGLGVLQPPQYLTDQLTLSQPGGQIIPTTVLPAPPDFQTLRWAWLINKLQNPARDLSLYQDWRFQTYFGNFRQIL